MDRNTFLAGAANFNRVTVELEGLGTVHVREVSAAEAREHATREKKPDADDLDNAAWLAVRVLVDENGHQLLTDADIPAVKAMPLRVLKEIGEAAAKASGAAAKKNGSEIPQTSAIASSSPSAAR